MALASAARLEPCTPCSAVLPRPFTLLPQPHTARPIYLFPPPTPHHHNSNKTLYPLLLRLQPAPHKGATPPPGHPARAPKPPQASTPQPPRASSTPGVSTLVHCRPEGGASPQVERLCQVCQAGGQLLQLHALLLHFICQVLQVERGGGGGELGWGGVGWVEPLDRLGSVALNGQVCGGVGWGRWAGGVGVKSWGFGEVGKTRDRMGWW